MVTWKPIDSPEFEGKGYLISSDGDVKSEKRGATLALSTNKISRGRYVCLIDNEGKEHRKNVAVLVAVAFVENPNNYMLVGFKDENPSNCNAKNLYWMPSKVSTPRKPRIYLPQKERETPKEKRVFQFTKNHLFLREWKSLKEAAETLGIPRSGIHACCTGKRKSASGYIWEFAGNSDSPKPAAEKEVQAYYEDQKKKNGPKKKRESSDIRRPVDQFTDSGEFVRHWDSIKEAGASFSPTAYTNILKAAQGKRNLAHGYQWRFTGDSRKVESIVKTHRKVLQLDEKGNVVKKWDSLKEACESFGSNSVGNITNCCKGRVKLAFGYAWKYAD